VLILILKRASREGERDYSGFPCPRPSDSLRFAQSHSKFAPGEFVEPPLAESESAVLHQLVNCTSMSVLTCSTTLGLGLPSTHSLRYWIQSSPAPNRGCPSPVSEILAQFTSQTIPQRIL
jgi:hypothetical protein